MIVKIILLIIFVILSILVMIVHVTDKNCNKCMLFTGLILWILGLYIGIAVMSIFK